MKWGKPTPAPGEQVHIVRIEEQPPSMLGAVVWGSLFGIFAWSSWRVCAAMFYMAEGMYHPPHSQDHGTHAEYRGGSYRSGD